MVRTHLFHIALLLVGLGFVTASCRNDLGKRERQPVPRFEPDTTANFPVAVPAGYSAETGHLVVLEDRLRPNGSTLRLPVVIIRAQSAEAEQGPVLYLGGGPGSSALNVAAYPGAYAFTEDRDFVVLEQRGTRYAEPALNCPEYVEALRQSARKVSLTPSIAGQVAAAAQCRARLESAGIDPASYSTASSAADVEDLRRVLDVEEWTLYGVSYGTRLALAVLRDFPETARAAVLDSVLPPQVRYDDESSANLEAAINLVFRDCASSTSCRSAFPDLRQRFYTALESAEIEPVSVVVQGEEGPISIMLRGAALAGLVDTSSPRGIKNAPLLLDGIARRDTSILKPAVAGLLGSSSFSWGMRLSVWCGEALPFSARATSGGPGTVLGGLESAAIPPEVCAAWDVAVRPVAETLPVSSDVPILLIAGEYDPHTPPVWADEATRTLPNSRVVVFRGAGHTPMQNWSGDGCAMRLAVKFIAAPLQVVDPRTALPDCVNEQAPPNFVTQVDDE